MLVNEMIVKVRTSRTRLRLIDVLCGILIRAGEGSLTDSNPTPHLCLSTLWSMKKNCYRLATVAALEVHSWHRLFW